MLSAVSRRGLKLLEIQMWYRPTRMSEWRDSWRRMAWKVTDTAKRPRCSFEAIWKDV
jgi:hypothetical protein